MVYRAASGAQRLSNMTSISARPCFLVCLYVFAVNIARGGRTSIIYYILQPQTRRRTTQKRDVEHCVQGHFECCVSECSSCGLPFLHVCAHMSIRRWQHLSVFDFLTREQIQTGNGVNSWNMGEG